MCAIITALAQFVEATRPFSITPATLRAHLATSITSSAYSVHAFVGHGALHVSGRRLRAQPTSAHQALCWRGWEATATAAWAQLVAALKDVSPILAAPSLTVSEVCGDSSARWHASFLYGAGSWESDTPDDLAHTLVRLAQELEGIPRGTTPFAVTTTPHGHKIPFCCASLDDARRIVAACARLQGADPADWPITPLLPLPAS